MSSPVSDPLGASTLCRAVLCPCSRSPRSCSSSSSSAPCFSVMFASSPLYLREIARS
eukprot:CAMPEP_0180123884 /NCGR_PEP_ID=MMETSP0986-20121125/4349_1 /TAXON_ID=697907 /ORGANISM="non described non described, Strain CCMP2293" /LENGTH=56 /DNA_ID=CAMNT_0022063173 /DNA_START=289 /DNA_END=455 /DNA_ORIENTATION=-